MVFKGVFGFFLFFSLHAVSLDTQQYVRGNTEYGSNETAMNQDTKTNCIRSLIKLYDLTSQMSKDSVRQSKNGIIECVKKWHGTRLRDPYFARPMKKTQNGEAVIIQENYLTHALLVLMDGDAESGDNRNYREEVRQLTAQKLSGENDFQAFIQNQDIVLGDGVSDLPSSVWVCYGQVNFRTFDALGRIFWLIQNSSTLSASKNRLMDLLVKKIGECIDQYNFNRVCIWGKMERVLQTLEGEVDGIWITHEVDMKTGALKETPATFKDRIVDNIVSHIQKLPEDHPIQTATLYVSIPENFTRYMFDYYFEAIREIWRVEALRVYPNLSGVGDVSYSKFVELVRFAVDRQVKTYTDLAPQLFESDGRPKTKNVNAYASEFGKGRYAGDIFFELGLLYMEKWGMMDETKVLPAPVSSSGSSASSSNQGSMAGLSREKIALTIQQKLTTQFEAEMRTRRAEVERDFARERDALRVQLAQERNSKEREYQAKKVKDEEYLAEEKAKIESRILARTSELEALNRDLCAQVEAAEKKMQVDLASERKTAELLRGQLSSAQEEAKGLRNEVEQLRQLRAEYEALKREEAQRKALEDERRALIERLAQMSGLRISSATAPAVVDPAPVPAAAPVANGWNGGKNRLTEEEMDGIGTLFIDSKGGDDYQGMERRLAEVSQFMPLITKVVVSGNAKMGRISLEIVRLQNLTELHMPNNGLTKLTMLLVKLQKLTVIDVSGNKELHSFSMDGDSDKIVKGGDGTPMARVRAFLDAMPQLTLFKINGTKLPAWAARPLPAPASASSSGPVGSPIALRPMDAPSSGSGISAPLIYGYSERYSRATQLSAHLYDRYGIGLSEGEREQITKGILEVDSNGGNGQRYFTECLKFASQNLPWISSISVGLVTKVERIPKEIGMIPGLTELRIPNNSLVELPYELSSLKNLEVLDVSGNKNLCSIVGELPEGKVTLQRATEIAVFFSEMPKLRTLILGGTGFPGDINSLVSIEKERRRKALT